MGRQHVRAADYSVCRIPHGEGRSFITAMHYAKGAANTSVFCHGMKCQGELVGVAMWMPPTKPCGVSVAGDGWRGVLALSRLAIAPDVPTNGASFLIGRSIRLIRKDRRWTHLVTYADTAQGHTGAIYRATNWHYAGTTRPEPRWETADGRQVSRKAGRSRSVNEMLSLGHRRLPPSVKHKFTMVLRGSSTGPVA